MLSVRTRVVNSGNVISVTMATARPDPTSCRPALPLAIPVLLCFFASLARSELLTIIYCPSSSSMPFVDNNIAVKNASQDLRSNMVRNISDDGFLYASNSPGRSETKVYGMALCRPDVAVDRGCRSCLQDAADLLYDCDKGVVWSDNCYMRSESYDFDGGAGNDNFIGVRIKNSAGDDMDPTPLFERVIEKAQKRRILYGVENTTVLNGTESRYAMAQCTRDINDAKCGKCLNDLLLNSGKKCTGIQSCRLAEYNCNLAYDSSPSFLDVDDPKPSEAPPPSPNPTPGSESPKASPPNVVVPKKNGVVSTGVNYTAAVLGSTAAALCFLVLCIICLCRKCRGRQKPGFEKMGNQLDSEQNISEDQLPAALMNNEGLRHYRHEDIKAATNGFNRENVIGQGGYGKVYKGLLHGEDIAVKVRSKNSCQGADEFTMEVQKIGQMIRHRSFVPLKGYCTEENCIVYEYMPNRSVKDLISGERKRELDWNRRKNIILGIARGLRHLHNDAPQRYAHGDLKLANVLLDQNYNPKISDLGMARSNEDHLGRVQSQMDVFKFGVMLVEIVRGQITNSNLPLLLDSTHRKFRDKKLLELVDPDLDKNECGEEAVRFIHIGLLCVQRDVGARPDIVTVENWLQNVSPKLDVPEEPANCAADGMTITGPNSTGS